MADSYPLPDESREPEPYSEVPPADVPQEDVFPEDILPPAGDSPELTPIEEARMDETYVAETVTDLPPVEEIETEIPLQTEAYTEIPAETSAFEEKPRVEQTLPPFTPAYTTPQPLSPQDERTWAMLAHLSVLANLVTGFLGPVAALLIYLIYKDRSRYVAFHAMQSFVFQLIWWIGGGVLIGITWAITGILSAILIGILCIPFSILLTLVFLAMPLVALIYGVVGAIQTNQGLDFRYWLVGDWVRNSLRI